MKIRAYGLFFLLLAAPVTAGEPNSVINCGFSVPNAAGNGFVRGVAGLGLDCLLWACIPVIATLGVGSAVLEEIDQDCAGSVWEGTDSNGRYRYTISWDYDSKSRAEEGGREYCVSQLSACRQRVVFRFAAAAYRPRFGTYAEVAQAGDIPTAKAISRSRCESAANGPCQLVFARANRN